jgi:hypothetical protein
VPLHKDNLISPCWAFELLISGFQIRVLGGSPYSFSKLRDFLCRRYKLTVARTVAGGCRNQDRKSQPKGSNKLHLGRGLALQSPHHRRNDSLTKGQAIGNT